MNFVNLIDGCLSVEGTKDRVVWVLSCLGRCTCKSFRRAFVGMGDEFSIWKILWDLSILLKVTCFGWLVLRDRVAIRVTTGYGFN